MTAIAIIKFAHVLGFVYWLGPDLGVWYSSYYAADRKRPRDTRLAAIRILLALDLAPRICMTMMLPIGIQLANTLGLLRFPAWVVGLVWLLGFLWLAMALYLHFARSSRYHAAVTRIDFGFRLAVMAALAAFATVSLSGSGGARADWVAWKLMVFAALIGCGLMVRVRLRPFGPACVRLAAGEATEQDNDIIERSIAATRPWVLLIWFGLLVSAALGLRVI